MPTLKKAHIIRGTSILLYSCLGPCLKLRISEIIKLINLSDSFRILRLVLSYLVSFKTRWLLLIFLDQRLRKISSEIIAVGSYFSLIYNFRHY